MSPIAVLLVLLTIHQSSANSQARFQYYQLFTPLKLSRAASFIHHQHTVAATKLTFLSAPQNYARLMKVPLIPAGTVSPDANLVVKMIVGTDKEIGQGESDPSYVISDGQYFIGAHIRDKNNYRTVAPCIAIEGASGDVIGNRRLDSNLPKTSQSDYPGRFETWLNLSGRWGTCFVSLDGGFSKEMAFQRKLNPHNGLFMEVYADASSEKVGIKYIEVIIEEEN